MPGASREAIRAAKRLVGTKISGKNSDLLIPSSARSSPGLMLMLAGGVGVAGRLVVFGDGMAAHRALVRIGSAGFHHFAIAFPTTHHSVMVIECGATRDEEQGGARRTRFIIFMQQSLSIGQHPANRRLLKAKHETDRDGKA